MNGIPPYPEMPACDCIGKCIGHNYENHDGERGGLVYYGGWPTELLVLLVLCAAFLLAMVLS